MCRSTTALANLAKDASTRQQAIDFFLAEYTLDRYIALMKKPVIAFLDGHTSEGLIITGITTLKVLSSS